MAENSAIEWTDHTFNPWEGCQKVGPGCDHCYAETRNARFGGGTAPNWGPNAPRRLTSKSNWQKPLRWQADAAAFLAKHGRRQRVFCASLADVFDNAVLHQWRSALFDLIHRTPDLDWLLLTKRIGNVAKMTDVEWGTEDWPTNVWLGATIVNQAEADRDIPKLLATRGPRIRFLSMEPLLGPVDLTVLHWEGLTNINALTGAHGLAMPMQGTGAKVDWVIVGGESGPGARPMHPDWLIGLRDQCEAAGTPFLFKQWGEHLPVHVNKVTHSGIEFRRIGKKAAGRRLHGVQHDGVPLFGLQRRGVPDVSTPAILPASTNSALIVRGDDTHAWGARLGMEICSDCGTVRRHDRMNSACRGKVKVALRGERSVE